MREFNRPPVNARERAQGITEAITNTKKSIENYKSRGAKDLVLIHEQHLKSLQGNLQQAEEKAKRQGI